MRTRKLWYVLLPALGLAISVWAANAPPPQAHPHMQVPAGAKRLHTELERVTSAAAKKGQYTCCIAPPCEFCAVHMATCPCGKNLAAGKGVCRECKGGWEVGEGRISGVNAADVKGMSVKDVMGMMKGGMKKGGM
jgi:hypothetical protein